MGHSTRKIVLLRFCFLLFLFSTCKKDIPLDEKSHSSLRYFTGGNIDKLTKVSATKDGGFLYCGGTGVGESGVDGFVMKVDAQGNQEWYRTFGGEKFDHFDHAIECSDGGFIAVGQTNSIGKGAIDGNLMHLDYIIKFKATGELEWEHSFIPNSDGPGELYYVAESKDHFIYTTGIMYGDPNESTNVLLMKLDMKGNLVDFTMFNDFMYYKPAPVYSRNEEGSFVSFAENGDVIVSGEMSGPTVFNTIPYLISVDPNNFSQVNYYYPYSDYVSGSSYMINTGFRRPPTAKVLNATDGYFIGTYQEDLFLPFMKIQLIHTDFDGNLIWQKQYTGLGSSFIYDMKMFPDGSILIAGASSAEYLNYAFPEASAYQQTMLMKVDNKGNEIWTQYGGSEQNVNMLRGVQINADGSISGAGFTCLSRVGYDKMFWVKYDSDGRMITNKE